MMSRRYKRYFYVVLVLSLFLIATVARSKDQVSVLEREPPFNEFSEAEPSEAEPNEGNLNRQVSIGCNVSTEIY